MVYGGLFYADVYVSNCAWTKHVGERPLITHRTNEIVESRKMRFLYPAALFFLSILYACLSFVLNNDKMG